MNVLPSKLREASSLLEHMCHLDFKKDANFRRMSGIICTIGPSCRDSQTIYEMVKAGMNVARINFSYESQEEHSLTVDLIHDAEERYSKELGFPYHVALVGDLKGREIRTGLFSGRKIVDVKKGDQMKCTINPDLSNKGTKDLIFLDHPGIIKDVEIGQVMYLDDNAITMVVREIGVDCIMCQILSGGQLRNKVNVVIPEARLALPIVSEKDAYDIKFCLDNNFDYLMLSKMYEMEDILHVRRAVGERGKHIKFITKLENLRELENLDGILDVSDAILISRADLAIEMQIGRIFLAQKALTARCNRFGKPVIIGPQLLASMNNSTVPIRSDIADVGNALLDGADAMMLSSETSVGQYPVEAVKVLAHACKEAEIAIWHRKLFEDLIGQNLASIDGVHAVAISAVTTAATVSATAIIAITVSGKSAHLLSRYRPRCPVLAVTRCSRVARQASIYRGIIPILVSSTRIDDYLKDVEDRINYALNVAYRMGVVRTSDAIVVLSPWKHSSGFTNNVRVIYAYFEKDPIECMREKQAKLVAKAPVRQFLGT